MLKIFKNIRDFFGKVVAEMKQVTFLPRRKAFGWGFFIFIVVIVGVILIFALDTAIIKIRDLIIF